MLRLLIILVVGLPALPLAASEESVLQRMIDAAEAGSTVV
jgi:hypothetical protein